MVIYFNILKDIFQYYWIHVLYCSNNMQVTLTMHMHLLKTGKTSCRRAAATICPAPLLAPWRRSASRRHADGNAAAVSHGQHVLTPTDAAI